MWDFSQGFACCKNTLGISVKGLLVAKIHGRFQSRDCLLQKYMRDYSQGIACCKNTRGILVKGLPVTKIQEGF